jgi:hypothetical protein
MPLPKRKNVESVDGLLAKRRHLRVGRRLPHQPGWLSICLHDVKVTFKNDSPSTFTATSTGNNW